MSFFLARKYTPSSAKRSPEKFHRAQVKRRFSNRLAWPWKISLPRCSYIEKLFPRKGRELIGNQLPSFRTLYPNMGASVLACGRLTTVLSFNGYAARRNGAVLVNAHHNAFFFLDRIERRCARLGIREALRFR